MIKYNRFDTGSTKEAVNSAGPCMKPGDEAKSPDSQVRGRAASARLGSALMPMLISILLIPGCSTIEVAVDPQSRALEHHFPANEKGGFFTEEEEQPDASTAKVERIRVVVMPIEVRGEPWGGQFSDAIALNLIRSGKFDVLERSELQRILRELHLQQTGLIDPSTGAKIGRIVGARFIIAGEAIPKPYQDQEGNVHDNMVDTCTIRIIDVETATNYAIIRKEPGIAWDWPYRFMWLLPLTMIWDREDILIDSSKYDEIASQVVTRFLNTLQHGAPGF